METNKNIISLTHNDLDGVGCQVVIRWQYRDVFFKSISYNIIIDTLKELEQLLEYDRSKTHIFISDISFKMNELELLKQICNNNPSVKFIMSDHHLRDKEILSIYKSMPLNFIDLYSTERCSASTLFYYFNINNLKIKNLIDTINSYDMWLSNNNNFLDSLVLNEIYESMTHNDFLSNISYYGQFQDVITRKFEKTKKKIQSFKDSIIDNSSIYYNNNVCVAYLDKYKSILQYYIDKPIIIIISSNFNFSIRLSNKLTDAEIIQYREIFFDYFKLNGYDYYYAHKQVFGFNSTINRVYEDIDSFITFIEEKLTKKLV